MTLTLIILLALMTMTYMTLITFLAFFTFVNLFWPWTWWPWWLWPWCPWLCWLWPWWPWLWRHWVHWWPLSHWCHFYPDDLDELDDFNDPEYAMCLVEFWLGLSWFQLWYPQTPSDRCLCKQRNIGPSQPPFRVEVVVGFQFQLGVEQFGTDTTLKLGLSSQFVTGE